MSRDHERLFAEAEREVMGHCKDCKWWKQYGYSRKFMMCTRPDSGASGPPLFYPCSDGQNEYPVMIITEPDFGCVQFEAKELCARCGGPKDARYHDPKRPILGDICGSVMPHQFEAASARGQGPVEVHPEAEKVQKISNEALSALDDEESAHEPDETLGWKQLLCSHPKQSFTIQRGWYCSDCGKEME